jgi:hypothetical protein
VIQIDCSTFSISATANPDEGVAGAQIGVSGDGTVVAQFLVHRVGNEYLREEPWQDFDLADGQKIKDRAGVGDDQ